MSHGLHDEEVPTPYSIYHSWKLRTVYFSDEILIRLLKSDISTGKYRLTIRNKNMHCVDGKEPSFFMRHNITDSSTALALIDQYLGPDEMLLDIHGKTLQSFVPDYSGCGSYTQNFEILEQGIYHIALIRTRTRYSAINELYLEYPSYEIDYLVADWMDLTALPTLQEVPCSRTEKGGIEGYWKATVKNNALKNGVFDNITIAKSTVPSRLTRTKDARNGFYVMQYVNVTSSGFCAGDMDQYEWTPGPTCTTWTTDIFKLPNSKPHPYNVTITGDSHAGYFSQYLTKYVDTVFVRKVLCEILPEQTAMEFGSSWLFFNCGHHPAAHHHFTIVRYYSTIVRLATMLQQARYTRNNFAWYESNPQPMRQDVYVYKFKDWRTLHRIKLFNILSEDILRENGYTTFIRVFNEFLPFVHGVCDIAHYSVATVYQPVIEQSLKLYDNKVSKHMGD